MTVEQAQAIQARHTRGPDQRCTASRCERWPCFHWLDAQHVITGGQQ